MERNIFDDDHHAFRDLARTFVDREIAPYHEQWEEDGQVSREVWLAAGKAGLLGTDVPEEYGGGGVDDYRYNAIIVEELVRAGASGIGFPLQNDVVAPYLLRLANDEQKRRWLPGFCSGEIITAIAMTEPGTGSDLAGMRTTARKSADGSHYVLNGAKTFITGGVHADRVIVCARTSPSLPDDRRFGISLLVVDTKSPGYSVGRKLDKIGLRVSDTAELTFSDVIVPAGDLLGEEDKGFSYLGQNLPQERLSIAYGAYAQAAAAVRFAVEYTKQRTVFGKEVASFQNTKFELAACQAKVDAAQAVADRALEALDAGELTPAEAASAKLFCTETASEVIDRCLQLHGGYGYINEYPIARLYADNRVNRIYGGTSEVMKTIIAKNMGL